MIEIIFGIRKPPEYSSIGINKRRSAQMWVVVYVAPNQKIALILKELLEIEGILVRLKGTNLSEIGERNVEIMVSNLEIEEANEVINNALQSF
jgi:hypothetical protein